MKLSTTLLATAIALASISTTALAQNTGAEAETVTLRVNSGTAMASQGGDFVTAPSGTALQPGSRVMIAENSAATLVYSNGCTRDLTSAGVYPVSATCVLAAPVAGGTAAGVDAGGALTVAGGTALVAAGLASMDKDSSRPTPPPPPPVSR